MKNKTKQINLKKNRIGALNRTDSTLFTNNRDRKWRMSYSGFPSALVGAVEKVLKQQTFWTLEKRIAKKL